MRTQQDTMNHVDTIKVEYDDNNNHSCHNGLTVRNGANMNLYGIYKRDTIEYWVARDDIHKRLTGESEV